jgi:hypothetical protein
MTSGSIFGKGRTNSPYCDNRGDHAYSSRLCTLMDKTVTAYGRRSEVKRIKMMSVDQLLIKIVPVDVRCLPEGALTSSLSPLLRSKNDLMIVRISTITEI